MRSKKSHYELEGGEEFSEILATYKALGDHGKERKGPVSAKEHASCSAYSDSSGACGIGEKTVLH